MRTSITPRAQLFASSSFLACLLIGQALIVAPAAAQTTSQTLPTQPSPTVDPAVDPAAEPPAQSDAVGDVIVTGSRIQRNGYAAPTPVAVLSAETLSQTAPSSQEALRQLPQIRGSTSPQTSGSTQTGSSSTAETVSLRNLGPQRTLVLFDGRRTTPATAFGATDTSTFPTNLLSRVEIVTGGASAVYGSDAVAGVVNFILDTKFSGVKVDARSGIAQEGDAGSQQVSVAAGTSLFGDRAHLVLSAQYRDAAGIRNDGRDWARQRFSLLAIPGNNPLRLVLPNTGQVAASYGGVITGPAALAGRQFVAGGGTVPFNPGSPRSSTTGVNGDGQFDLATFLAPARATNVFGHVSFDVTDRLEAFAEASYGFSSTTFNIVPQFAIGTASYTIYADNAFLPQPIRAIMTQNNIASFTLSRVGRDDYGIVQAFNKTDTASFVGGFKGKFGMTWGYNAYAQYGETILNFGSRNNPIRTNIYNSADAVINPANGQIVCRTTLTNPGNGCVPSNLFGPGAPSAEARDYVMGDLIARQRTTQTALSASIEGELFSLWAGPVSVATGAEYRRIATVQTSDAIAQSVVDGTGIRGFPASLQGQLGGYSTANNQPLSGAYNVKEVFAEVVVPLLKDLSFAHLLELNGAVRYADYSLSGGVTSWKIGGTFEPIAGLRLRATRSRDVRAANIAELFQGATVSQSSILDPTINNAQVPGIIVRRVGNPALTPELASTTTFGFVYQPSWLPGLGFSVDAFNIKLKDAISVLAAQDIVNQCAAGATALCSLITRNPAGQLQSIIQPNLNIAQLQVKGVDVEASYRTRLIGGDLSLRALGSYIGRYSQANQGAAVINRAGQIGVGAGGPKYSVTAAANYSNGPFSLLVQERYLSSAVRDVTFTAADININGIPERFYTDLNLSISPQRGSLGNARFFIAINNLFDKDPPLTVNAGPAQAVWPAYTDGSLYDVRGRYFTAGFEVKF